MYLLGSKKQRVHKRFEKAVIDERYIEQKEYELDEKGKKTEKDLNKDVISSYLSSISQVVKILDLRNYSRF